MKTWEKGGKNGKGRVAVKGTGGQPKRGPCNLSLGKYRVQRECNNMAESDPKSALLSGCYF